MSDDPLASPAELEPWPDHLQAEVQVGGRRPGPPPECAHGQLYQLVVFAAVAENEDGTGAIVGRQAKLKARCGECGLPMRFLIDSARASSSDGELGLVVDLEPALEQPDEGGSTNPGPPLATEAN